MSKGITLGEACVKIVDCEHKTAPEAVPGTEYGYSVGTPHIRNGRILLEAAKRVDKETYASWTVREVPRDGDLILAREAPVGQVGRITQGERICLGQRTVLLRPDIAKVDSRYLHYLLLSPAIQGAMASKAAGSTVAHLNVKDIRELSLPPLPVLQYQRAVADLLATLDLKFAVNERIAATYEQLLQCRFTELGLSDEPDGDTSIAVTDLVEFNPKLAKPSAEEPVYVDMAALQTDRAGIPVWTRRAPKSGTRFMNGDTLLARITPCLENGKTGFVDFMADGEVGIGSTEFIVMRSRPGVPAEFSYFLARDIRFREHAIRNMLGTSGRQRVSAADAANYFVNRPDADALAAFGRETEAAFSHMKSLQGENRNLATLRDTLLPQLMSGRLRIKDAEKIVEDHA
ncbi:restriction endonuclease subunit S [Streptomyces achromogenes]|uniref:restriction endonuclease subunit S n=1 Tax=Streptomyces achromogenes TaxID=67255 RepID=UPI00370263F0